MPARERQILRLRYGEGLLIREVAAKLQVSPPRIWQLLRRAEYRLARRIVYPDLDPLHRFDRRRRVPSSFVPSLAKPPERRPPIQWHWTSEPGPPVVLAPFGTLGDIIDALDPYPLEEKTRLLECALESLEQGISKRGAR